MVSYKVTSSPHTEDDGLPWEYEEGAFVSWVDEVFLEGYKKGDDAPFPSPEEALAHIQNLGYTVEVVKEACKHPEWTLEKGCTVCGPLPPGTVLGK